jgi:hypothetical protein
MENNYRVQAIRCCVNCSYCGSRLGKFVCLINRKSHSTISPVGICDRYIYDGLDYNGPQSLSETREQTPYCLKDLEEVLNRGPEESVFNRNK